MAAPSPTTMTASGASSIAIGPLVTYKAKFGETEIDFRLKWAHEVEVKNRMKGDAVFLDITGKF